MKTEEGDSMNTSRRSLFFALFMAFFVLAGCATVLPSGSQQSSIHVLPWKNYDEFSQNTEKVVAFKTTLDDLKKSGFNPKSIPNTEFLNKEKVRQKLLPRQNDSVDSLPPGAKECYTNFSECPGYAFRVQKINIRGVGSAWLRVIRVKKEDETTGWKGTVDFYLLPRKYIPSIYLPMDDGVAEGEARGEEAVVVFMSVGGTPNIQELVIKKTPLGPLDIAIGAGRKMSPVSPPDMETE